MLGNVAPRALRVTSQPVVYSGRGNVTRLTLEVLSGRRCAPLDLSAVTRWLLVFPEREPQVLIDSDTEAVFSAAGNVLTVDLSGYAIDASIQPCWLIAYDAEHPMGQVLVDNVDCVVSFDFRAVSGTGLVPLPLAEYVTAAPADGKKYLQQNGGWVEATELVSGVASVNGFTGDVVLDAADVGAEPAGTASSAVGAHVAAPDPHPQYLLDSEKGAANGVATLDAGSKIPLAQLPAAAITDTFVVNTEAAMLALSAQVGDVAIRPDISSSFILQVEPASALSNWQQIVTPSVGGGAPVGSATPQNLGVASPGVSGNASREDHVHAMPSAGDVGAAPADHVGATGTAHGVATTSVDGFMSAADKTRLDGVASGATANSSDATLLARANHTGTQEISTVTGLQAALDKAMYAPVITEAGTARVSLLTDAGCYLRFTSTSAKAYTVAPQVSVPWVADSEIHGRNAGTSNLTLTPGSGVTLNAQFGGTLVVPTGGSFTLKRAAENVWDVIGQTVAA